MNNIWFDNTDIDKIINIKNFEYICKIENLQICKKDFGLDYEYIIIDNKQDKYMYMSIRKIIKDNDPNNFKIGIIKENCKTYLFHFKQLNDFISLLHKNNLNILNILHYNVDEKAPQL